MQHLGRITKALCWVKEVSLKRFVLYDSIYMTVSIRQNNSDTELIRIRVGEVWLKKGDTRAFSGVKELLCPDCGDSYMNPYIFKIHTIVNQKKLILLHDSLKNKIN